MRAAVALAVICSCTAASAQSVPPYSDNYTGAFVAAGATAGSVRGAAPDAEASWGPAVGAWVQWSAPLQVLDAQLSWLHSEVGDGQDTLVAAAAMHPLFIAHLESSPLFYVLGSFYVLAGLDVDFVHGPDGVTDPGIHLGAGFDVPLDDVDDGGAFWLGFEYRRNTIDHPREHYSVEEVQHVALLRLSWRNNGFVFATPDPGMVR
jgi:hypothetical protein